MGSAAWHGQKLTNHLQTAGKRNIFMHNCEGECSSREHESWSVSFILSIQQSLELLGLVFETGLSITPLVGHPGR